MGTSRRGFMKNILKGAAVLGLAPVLKHLPEIPVEEAPTKFLKTIKGDIMPCSCKDWAPQVIIQDYSPGDLITYQDLSGEPNCRTCMYGHACNKNGAGFDNNKYEEIEYENFTLKIRPIHYYDGKVPKGVVNTKYALSGTGHHRYDSEQEVKAFSCLVHKRKYLAGGEYKQKILHDVSGQIRICFKFSQPGSVEVGNGGIKFDNGNQLPGKEKELYLTEGKFDPEEWGKMVAKKLVKGAFRNLT